MTDCDTYWQNHPVTKHYTSGGDPVVLPIIDRVKPTTVLEVGCGAGRNLDLLASERPELKLTGYDFNPEMIEAGRALYPHLKHRLFPALELLAPHYDLVFTLSVVDHVEDPEEFIQWLLSMGRYVALIEPWVGEVCELNENYNVEDLYSFSWNYSELLKDVKVIHRERTPLKGGLGGLSGHYHTWVIDTERT